MIEEDLTIIKGSLMAIEHKLDKLIPTVEDNSKSLSEAKELANKGKKPRKRPKKPDMKDWDNPPKGEMMFKTLDKKRISATGHISEITTT